MEVKAIIRELLDRGMAPEEIKRNLLELGVQNPDELLNDAREHMKEVSLTQETPKDLFKDADDLKAFAKEEKPAASAFVSTGKQDADSKLDEIIALLKALQEINKKVLETDRQVLLRLKV